jgi:hypothetical protein
MTRKGGSVREKEHAPTTVPMATIKVLENNGDIRNAELGTVEIDPSNAGSNVTVIENANGSHIDTLKMEHLVVGASGTGTIPEPPAGSPKSIPKATVDKLISDVHAWAEARGEVTDDSVQEFHENFGPQIILITQVLRNCSQQHNALIHLYNREKYPHNLKPIVGLQLFDLQLLTEDTEGAHCTDNSVGNASGGNDSTNIGGGSRINQQSSGDCSPNIVGNGNTTNCPPASRVMPEPKLKAFSAALGEVQGHIRVVQQSSAPDTFELVTQICTAADSKQWSYGCPRSRDSHFGRDVVVKGLDCYSDDWNTPEAAAFKTAMTAGGLECHYKPGSYQSDGIQYGGAGVTLVVGDPQ